MNIRQCAAAVSFSLLLPPISAFAANNAAPAPIPDALSTPLAADPLGVTIRRLPNGLTLYMSPNHELPTITANIVVRAGSKNDPPDATGQAHYLEHMLFKGTTKLGTTDWSKESAHLDKIAKLYLERAAVKSDAAKAKFDKLIDAENLAASAFEIPNEIDKFYGAIGADGVNAHTSEDETVFEVTIPRNRLEGWARVESDRFRDPVFRLFPTELEAVYEEKNHGLDNAGRAIYEEMKRRLYPLHPYGRDILGTIEHLKNPALDKMRQFFDRWYQPGNMAIVLAGDFDPNEAADIVAKNFGSWPNKAVPAVPKFPLPPLKGESVGELRFEDEETVELAWPTVPALHPDADAITVMDMLMDNSVTGLLNLRLNQAQKVKSSGSFPLFKNDAGSWTVYAESKKGQTLEDAKNLLLDAVASLKAGDFSDDDIAAVITHLEIDKKYALESDGARAAMMAESFARRENWDHAVGYLDRLRKVTKADVVRVANRYLGDDRVVVFRRNGKQDIPKIAKPQLSPIALNGERQSQFLKELLAIPAKPIDPHWLVTERDYQIIPISGGKLYANKNPYDDLFQLVIQFKRGSRTEKRLPLAVELLELAGAGPYSADDFKKKLYALGSDISYSVGENESGVLVTGIDRNFWPTIELMNQRFDWPNISSTTLPDLVNIIVGNREDDKKKPGSIGAALGEFAKRGKDSDILQKLTNPQLVSARENDLVAIIQDFPHWQRRIGYTGPRSPSEIAKLLESWDTRKSPPPPHMLRYVRPQKTTVYFTDRDMVQAHVGVMIYDEPFDPKHYLDYQVYSQYMGGENMSSVIFQEIRESHALAYSAGGGHSSAALKGEDTGVDGSLACQADKTPEATELLANLLSHAPLTPERFAQTKESMIQTMRSDAIAFRGVDEELMMWEDQEAGPGDPRPARFDRLNQYTLSDFETVAKRFADRPATIWVLGPRDRVGLDKLKDLGAIEEKTVDQLFPY